MVLLDVYTEIELMLHLIETEIAAASLQKLVIHVCAPSSSWLGTDILSYETNECDQFCRSRAELLKPLIRPGIDFSYKLIK